MAPPIDDEVSELQQLKIAHNALKADYEKQKKKLPKMLNPLLVLEVVAKIVFFRKRASMPDGVTLIVL